MSATSEWAWAWKEYSGTIVLSGGALLDNAVQVAMRGLMDDMLETFAHGPKQGPRLRDCVPPELGWENEWYWLTPHDWGED